MATSKKTIQPQHLCKLLGVKHVKEADRVLSLAYAFLAYMNPGDELITSDIKFTKISKDLIHVESDYDLTQVVDSLEKKRVLRIPL